MKQYKVEIDVYKRQLVSMAIAIYFADWIRTILPVNLLFLLLLVQVIYAVSYTHLDVYKRQEYDDERSGGFAPLAKVSPDKKVVLGLITTKKPDSYTHLDVYKRQQHDSTEIKGHHIRTGSAYAH